MEVPGTSWEVLGLSWEVPRTSHEVAGGAQKVIQGSCHPPPAGRTCGSSPAQQGAANAQQQGTDASGAVRIPQYPNGQANVADAAACCALCAAPAGPGAGTPGGPLRPDQEADDAAAAIKRRAQGTLSYLW